MTNFRINNSAADLAVTTTSASVSVDAEDSAIRLHNAGPDRARVRFTIGASTAVVTDAALPAGATEIFDKGDADTVSAITASGTATLFISTGEGT